jgi:hypothetical protein
MQGGPARCVNTEQGLTGTPDETRSPAVLDLLTPRTARYTSARTFLTRAVTRVSATVAEFRTPVFHPAQPAPVAVEPAAVALVEPVVVEDPAEVFTADDMPALADIEAAAAQYFRAADQARTADRAKRASKKLLDRLPAGRFGAWLVERVESNRQTADLDQIRAIFKAHDLGAVPMKSSAPSLKVTRATDTDAAALVEAELTALAGV